MNEPWKRREVIGDCVLYQGDCMEIMPLLGKIDAVDMPDAVVYTEKYEKSAEGQRRATEESGRDLGASPRADNGSLCQRGYVASGNGGDIRGVAAGVPEGYFANGGAIEGSGSSRRIERALHRRNAVDGIPTDDCEGHVQSLRGDGSSRDPSPGPRPHKQHAEELRGSLQPVPHEPSQGRMVALPEGWAILTDPPYGIGFGAKHTKWSQNRGTRLGAWDQSIPDVGFLVDVCRDVIIWGGERFGLPVRRRWLTWVKPDAAPTFASTEMAWTSFDAPARHFTYAVGAVNRERVGHQTQKPLALMKWCLGFLPDAETVLDPFMGSGTTLVACAKLGRKGIGIELDPDYFEIACKRVREAYAQPDMFVEQAKPAKQIQEGFDL